MSEPIDIYGDPATWHTIQGASDHDLEMWICPQCRAICVNPWQHKAWHVQVDK